VTGVSRAPRDSAEWVGSALKPGRDEEVARVRETPYVRALAEELAEIDRPRFLVLVEPGPKRWWRFWDAW
jgi:hypothetical protein